MANPRFLGLLAVTSAGLFACSSSTSPNGQLGFTVSESLLVLEPENPAFGYVLLTSGTNTCPALQTGLETDQIGNYDFQVFVLFNVDASGDYASLASATYSVEDPSQNPPTPPALYSYSSVISTDTFCSASGANATSGSVTVSPFNSADGGASTLNYSANYSGTQLSGALTLTTCLVSANTPNPDAGTCVQCVPTGADGGVCGVQ